MSIFRLLKTSPRKSDTAFSRFIREASSEDKKRVYSDVMAKATKRQNCVIEQAAAKRKEHGLAKVD